MTGANVFQYHLSAFHFGILEMQDRGHSSRPGIGLTGQLASWFQSSSAMFQRLVRANHCISRQVLTNTPQDVLEFEETFIRPLAEATANAMFQQGITNQLVHLSPDAQHVRTLNLKRHVLSTL